jgi:hypothetical protein
VKDVGFHVLRKQTHILLSPSLHYFCWWIDIVMLVDDICTLANVIIVKPIQIDLVSWVALSHGVAMIAVV